MQFCSIAGLETGLGFDKNTYSHHLSLISSFRESWFMQWKTKRVLSACEYGSLFSASQKTLLLMLKRKKKLITDKLDGFQREIKINGQRLEEMKSFKYLDSVI